MWGILSKVNKKLVVAIPIQIILGFVFGWFFEAAWLKDLIVPFTFLMVFPMMVTLKIRKVFEGGDTKAQLLAQAINFGIVPFLAYAMGKVFFPNDPYLTLGLMLAGLVPTSGMTISWTGFAKGNVEAAVKMTVVGLTIGSLATPVYVKWLLGANIPVDMWNIVRQIGIIVFIPMVAGYLTQTYLIKKLGIQGFSEKWAPRFPALSTIGVLGIVFIAIAIKAKAIGSSPQLLVQSIVPLLIMYLINYVLSTAIGKFTLPRYEAIALVYGTVMRNLSIALALAINAFGAAGADAALVISLAYIIQVQSAAWYVRITNKVFGVAT